MLPPRFPRDAAATRARLLSAAEELFATTGFRATTTPMLAERAGIAEGTIYRHFSGKDALLNAAYAGAQEWAVSAIREVDAERGSPASLRLREVGRRLLRHAAERPSASRLLLQFRETDGLNDVSRASARAFREALESLVASGKSEGAVRAGPAELWSGVWLAVVSYAAERVARGEWTPDHPQAAMALDAAWDAISVVGASDVRGSR